jgi:hypothetical protein
MEQIKLDNCKEAIDYISDEYGVQAFNKDLTERADQIVSDAMDEYEDILSFDTADIHVIGVSDWIPVGPVATIAPVGVELNKEFDVSDTPEACVICVEAGAEDSGLENAVRHELAHFEDWRRRQTTDEHDEMFVNLLNELDAEENGWY